MALVVGENSYVTVLEADDYLSTRIGSTSWFALPETAGNGEDSKESMLVSAYYWLTQTSAFDLPSISTDENVKKAQIEASLYLVDFYDAHRDRMAKQTQGVSSFKLSKRSENYTTPQPNGIPQNVESLLSEYQSSLAFFDLKSPYDE